MAGRLRTLFLWVGMFCALAATSTSLVLQDQNGVRGTDQSAEVARALARFRGQPLILVFAPGLWGDYCKQSAELAAHAAPLDRRHVRVAWLLSHDAGQKTCDFSNSINDVEFKMGGTNLSVLPAFRFFHAPENAFTVLLLDSSGATVLRTSKPVLFAEIRRHLGAPEK